jgi:hypothetical protein
MAIMEDSMRKWLIVILYALIYILIHEGSHVLVSTTFGEFNSLKWTVISPEVVFNTPVPERAGFQWALIAGVPSVITISLGYLLLGYREKAAQLESQFYKGLVYFQTMVLMIADPLNLSIGPFVYDGDAIGVSVGLGISQYIIQAIFFILLLVNRELIATKLLPAFGVDTNHLLLHPWFTR